MVNASLYGSFDRRLEELLRACGLRTTVASLDDLAVLASPTATPPDLIVLDLREKPALPAAVPLIRQRHPRAGVVIVAPQLDPTLMLASMRAGVNEFLTEPLNVDDLRAAIDRVIDARRPAAKPGQVFAFVGGKGGVGTTTLAVNVATTLAASSRSTTLLIDLHIAYGDAALFVAAEGRFSVVDALENVHRMDEAFLRSLVCHTKCGLDILAASDRAMFGSVDPRGLRRLIECAARAYPHVILDMPRADAAILDVLEQVAKIVIVANQELSTVRSASRMAAALRQRYGKERVAVVVSRYDQVAEIGREDIERVLGADVTHVFPSNYRLAVEAMNRGRPLVLDNHNKLASSFDAFARSLAADGDVRAPAADPPPAVRRGLSLRR